MRSTSPPRRPSWRYNGNFAAYEVAEICTTAALKTLVRGHGTGVGPRKRDYRRAPVAPPTGEELAERWALPAGR
eukprot:8253778-Pyramimonas_sp.AAC.1